MSTAAIRRYWTTVAELGCIVTDGPAEIAHCHGGSVIVRGRELGRDYLKAKGLKLPYMDWLVLPLCPHWHRIAPDSLDLNVDAFEERFGPQVWHIDRLIARTGIDVWALAKSRHDLVMV